MEPRAAGPGPPRPAGSPRPPAEAAQAMDSPYANGAFSPPYPPYSSLPQPRGFYCSGPPEPTPGWSYGGLGVSPECPPEGSALRRQHGPGYAPPQTPGMPMPQYPYGDSSAGVTGQGPVPQPRALEDSWAPHSVYGVQPRYPWPGASGHNNLYVPESHPAWSSTGAPSHPPTWEPQGQDSVYDRAEQSPNQHSYYSDVNHRPLGTLNDHRMTKAAPAQPRVQYSAQPQLYDLAPRRPGARELGFKPPEQPSTNPAAMQPEIQRILHVMGEAEQLEDEVDEFVGKKTDKSYRLLEEMLTKLLLELDSIETGGQDSVRQARKESVRRIQAILEKLERKGL